MGIFVSEIRKSCESGSCEPGSSITTSVLSGLEQKVPMLKVILGSSNEAVCRNESLAV